MQFVHRPFQLTAENFGHHGHGVGQARFDGLAILLRGLGQYIIGNQIPVPGMADPDTQSGEIAAAQALGDTAQAVVAAVAASLFEPHRARRQIQFVMDNQDLAQRKLVKTRQRRHRLTAAIHEYVRFEDPAGPPLFRDFTALAVETGRRLELTTPGVGQRIRKPEPGIMPRRLIAGPRIAQPDYQAYRRIRSRGPHHAKAWPAALTGCLAASFFRCRRCRPLGRRGGGLLDLQGRPGQDDAHHRQIMLRSRHDTVDFHAGGKFEI